MTDTQCAGCQSIQKSGHKLYTYRDYKTVAGVAECARACRLTTWCQVNNIVDKDFCILFKRKRS